MKTQFVKTHPSEEGIYWARNNTGLWLLRIEEDDDGFLRISESFPVDFKEAKAEVPWRWGPPLAVP